VTLQCTPEAEMFYTLNGANPRDGEQYGKPFEVGSEAMPLLVYARSGEATKTANFQLPSRNDKVVVINETKPARLGMNKRLGLSETDRVFGVINRFKGNDGTKFKGVKVEIGEGEKTVSIRFQGRDVTADILEGTINSIRDVLDEGDSVVSVSIADGIYFENGFDAKEFAQIAGVEIKPGDLVQED